MHERGRRGGASGILRPLQLQGGPGRAGARRAGAGACCRGRRVLRSAEAGGLERASLMAGLCRRPAVRDARGADVPPPAPPPAPLAAPGRLVGVCCAILADHCNAPRHLCNFSAIPSGSPAVAGPGSQNGPRPTTPRNVQPSASTEVCTLPVPAPRCPHLSCCRHQAPRSVC